MDTIKQLTELDYRTLIIGVAIVAGAFKIICEFCSWVVKILGLETKSMRQRREEHKLLITTVQSLEALKEKQEEDVKQSIIHDERIKEDLKKVSNKVDAIAITLNNMQQASNITEMKKLKEKLVSYYNKYKNSDGWTSMDKDVFWDLFEEYEKLGGNSYVHTIIEPVMRELKVIDKE